MIIGLSGEAGSGKTTLARYLVKEHGFKEISFAKKVKDVARELFNLSDSQLYGSTKELTDHRYGKSPRAILQLLGEHIRSIHKSVWVEVAFRGLDFGPDARYVVSDARYLNELEIIRDSFCGDLWLIEKPGAAARNGIHGHISEEEFKGFEFDQVLTNDGSLEALYRAADRRLKEVWRSAAIKL